jgi:2-phosphosulfolactate phosphatase
MTPNIDFKKTVCISSYTDGLQPYPEDVATVAIDVIRATTTAVTAIASGRKCYPVSSVAEAIKMSQTLSNAVLVGELGGDMPAGFDMTNSPAQLAQRDDLSRPMILLSSSGTQLVQAISNRRGAYIASFQNYNATIDHLAENHAKVALIGAGSRGEFREEDQMCCAWIAEGLIEHGFIPEDETTRQLVEKWRGLPRNAFLMSRSVDYLRRSGQLQDLEFILEHFDDVNTVCRVTANEIVGATATVAAGTV